MGSHEWPIQQNALHWGARSPPASLALPSLHTLTATVTGRKGEATGTQQDVLGLLNAAPQGTFPGSPPHPSPAPLSALSQFAVTHASALSHPHCPRPSQAFLGSPLCPHPLSGGCDLSSTSLHSVSRCTFLSAALTTQSLPKDLQGASPL